MREYRIEIDRLPLSGALRQFSLQTGLQVGRLPDARASDKTFVGPLRGRYTAEAALTQLLACSGYSFEKVNERTIAIVAATSTPRSGARNTLEHQLEAISRSPSSDESRRPATLSHPCISGRVPI